METVAPHLNTIVNFLPHLLVLAGAVVLLLLAASGGGKGFVSTAARAVAQFRLAETVKDPAGTERHLERAQRWLGRATRLIGKLGLYADEDTAGALTGLYGVDFSWLARQDLDGVVQRAAALGIAPRSLARFRCRREARRAREVLWRAEIPAGRRGKIERLVAGHLFALRETSRLAQAGRLKPRELEIAGRAGLLRVPGSGGGRRSG